MWVCHRLGTHLSPKVRIVYLSYRKYLRFTVLVFGLTVEIQKILQKSVFGMKLISIYRYQYNIFINGLQYFENEIVLIRRTKNLKQS